MHSQNANRLVGCGDIEEKQGPHTETAICDSRIVEVVIDCGQCVDSRHVIHIYNDTPSLISEFCMELLLKLVKVTIYSIKSS